MKFLLAIIATIGFSVAANASWSLDACMDGCTSSLTVDSGSSGEKCGGSQESCNCFYATGCPAIVKTGSCSGMYPNFAGYTATGKYCCFSVNMCNLAEEEIDKNLQKLNDIKIAVTNGLELEEIFSESESMSSAFYGIVNTANRSPNAGRTQSVDARLDACLGHGTADTIGGSLLTCYSKCDNATNGSDTNFCHDNNSAVCDDRCECKLGSSSCNNL